MSCRITPTVCLIVCCLLAAAPLLADGRAPDTSKGAQLFEGLGGFHREFTTESDEAQRYLDQGMVWLQAFNYDEAERSFREAARLDPDCAIAWWGVAYAAGPSYNHSQMTERRVEISWEALQNTQARIENSSPVERALIEALNERFEKAGELDEAEEAFREDLAEFPDNGESPYGLSRVLHARGQTAEAEQVEKEFRLAWADADGPIATSCECIPEL